MFKTPVSYRQGFTKVVWLGRVCMGRVRPDFLPYMPTTTTAVPDDGSHFASLTYLSVIWADILSYYLSFHDGCMAFWVFETTASAHGPVDDTEMPGVCEWVGHCHTLLTLACGHGFTLHS
jgi:hypothetical protein